MKIDGLTPKQKTFVDSYDGSVTKAAAMAGLSRGYCSRLMGDVAKDYAEPSAMAVQTAILERNKGDSRIADRQERQEYWTEEMRDAKNDKAHRLRASELLGKSDLDFGERRQEVQAQSLADIAALMYVHRKKVDSKAIEGESDAV